MNVYIGVDMEGVAGISHPGPTRYGEDGFAAAAALMTGETNAAIERTESQATDLDRIVDIFTLEDSGHSRRAAAPAAPPIEVMPAPSPGRRTAQAARTYLTKGNTAIAAQ